MKKIYISPAIKTKVIPCQRALLAASDPTRQSSLAWGNSEGGNKTDEEEPYIPTIEDDTFISLGKGYTITWE